MKMFNAIFGIFAIFASFYCICFPGITFLSNGWILAVLLGGWGLCAVFDYFANRKKETNASKTEGTKAVSGALSLILGIAAAVFGVLAVFMPGLRLILDIATVGVFIAWLLINGCTSIVSSLSVGRKLKTKTWGWSLALGIITLLCGLYGIFHLLVMAQTIGLMFGVVMMLYGVRMLCSVFEKV